MGILGNGKNPSNEGDDFQMEGGDGGGGGYPFMEYEMDLNFHLGRLLFMRRKS